MKGFKGFAPGLVCRGKQYTENAVHEEKNATICHSGMHFCENPFDVLDHYPLFDSDGTPNEFAEVEALSDVKTDDGKKFCTTKLKVGAKLSFSGFVRACVDFMVEKTVENMPDSDGSSGNRAKIGSSGDYAQIGSSGDCAKIGSSGDYAQIGSSGDYAQIGSSGNRAKIGSSGDYAQIDCAGDDSVICCAGHNSIVRAKAGCWITLAEWVYSEEKCRYVPACVRTERVDGEKIKADTFYKLVNGEFVEVNA